MSASSGSYVAGADIIDLDRYMRASIRPSRHGRAYTREMLVVDAGGADRVPMEASSNSEATAGSRAHHKRFSHDSGLSDETYLGRRHKLYRRTSENKCHRKSRNVASISSTREFRAAYEKVLRDQQEQIARVAEICERLVQPQIEHCPQTVTNGSNGINNSPQISQNMGQSLNHEENVNKIGNLDCNVNQNSDKQNFGQNVTQKIKRRAATPDSSDVTSSSGSSRDIRRKYKHRSESCKTYNLIMDKLDELSHMFATRRVPASSGSVSMCNKLVATEDVRHSNTPVIQVMHSSRVSDRARSEGRCSNKRQLAVTCAPVVDISPGERNNVVESIVEHWSDSASGAAAGVFDFDDPLHLYAQAKRLQATHASARRTSNDRLRNFQDKFGDQLDDKFNDMLGNKLDSSLCALCRGYWRSVRTYLKQQLFGTCS
ncbi:unnamed protein product, partial [Brenthis ino]